MAEGGAVLLAGLQRFAEDVAERRTRVRRTVLRDGLLFFGDLHRLDREVRLFRAVEADDHRIELLADLVTLGALFVAVAAKVGALDEAGGAIVASLNFEAVVADLENGDGDDVVLLHRTGRGGAAANGRSTRRIGRESWRERG